ncbi:MAG TPA: metallophosphoesterase [bacterium]|nr:metallophosphoesterase [bacterium]
MRKLLWIVVTLAVLAGGIWLGSTAAWRLHEAALRHGCLRVLADVAPVEIHPAESGHVRFAAIGDTGTASEGERRVAGALKQVCARDGCDFVALLGDNFYPDGVKSMNDPLFNTAFESVFAGLQVPVLAVLGNHDVHNQALYEVFHTLDSKLWRMPNFEYHFASGPARFFAINTNCQPVTWWRLTPKVETPFKGWTFVMGHHSLYADGPHGDADWLDRTLWGSSQPHVDFYLAGHNHLLEHFQRQGEETDYVVSGAGGGEEPDPATFAGPSTAQKKFERNVPGFAWFDVTDTQATLRFFDANATLLYQYRRTRIAQ